MLLERFAFAAPALVNFVGAGGKTELILKLAREYSKMIPVIFTTTTRIHPPEVEERMACVACDDQALLKSLLESCVRDLGGLVRVYVVTRPLVDRDLLPGVAADFAQSLDRELFPMVLNEADGARGMSLKMPREGEPVLMRGASYLVPVIGLDCLGLPLGPSSVFRWELAKDRLSLRDGGLVTPELAAAILLHPSGVCKDWSRQMQLIPFINKVDREEDVPIARELASHLIRGSHYPVRKVVWGSVKLDRAGVFTRDTI